MYFFKYVTREKNIYVRTGVNIKSILDTTLII